MANLLVLNSWQAGQWEKAQKPEVLTKTFDDAEKLELGSNPCAFGIPVGTVMKIYYQGEIKFRMFRVIGHYMSTQYNGRTTDWCVTEEV